MLGLQSPPMVPAARMMFRAASTAIKATRGNFAVGAIERWDATNAWLENLTDEKVDRFYENSIDWLWENMAESRKHVAERLAPDMHDEQQMAKTIELLGNVDTEIGQEYEMAFNDAWAAVVAPNVDEISDEDHEVHYPSGCNSGFWDYLSTVHKIEFEDAAAEILSKDTDYTKDGVVIDLSKRRSRIAILFMEAIERQSMANIRHDSPMPLEGEDAPAAAEPLSDNYDPEEYDMDMEEDLGQLAADVAEQMVKSYVDGRNFDAAFDREVWKNIRQFEAKWEKRMPRLLGLGRRRPATASLLQIAEKGPAWSGHVFLGMDEDELYYLDLSDMTVVSGDLIKESDLEAKTLEHWESFFDGDQDQIRSMMDRGFLSDARRDIVEDLVRHGASELLEIEEIEKIESPTLGEVFEDEDEAKQAISDHVDGMGLPAEKNNKKWNAAFSKLWDELERETVYRSASEGRDFRSEREYEDVARRHYEDNFKEYAGDVSGYAKAAAQEVVDTDGSGHGLDVEELDNGNYLSVRSIGGASGIMGDEHTPDSVKKNLRRFIGTQFEQRREPLE